MRAFASLTACALLVGCTHTPAQPVEPLFLEPNGYAGDLYWASEPASGGSQCDPGLGGAARQQFERYFEYRVETVMEAYEARYGPAEEFLVPTICRRWNGSDAAFFRNLRDERREFDRWLTRVEAGIASWDSADAELTAN